MTNRFPNSLVVANGKGGVGKTTICANLAAAAATDGNPVVVVDLDPQGNLATEFGVSDHDNGKTLAGAALGLIDKPTLHPTGRANLSYIGGGDDTQNMAQVALIENMGRPQALGEMLYKAIQPVYQPGTLLFFDTPPAAGSPLADAAMLVAQRLLIPTKKDENSIAGVGKLLSRVLELGQSTNEIVDVVGVVMFDVDPRATKINREVRANVESQLGGAFPVLNSMIRHADKAQLEAKIGGLVAAEYASLAETTEVISYWEARRRGIRDPLRFASNAGSLAFDYASLVAEVEASKSTYPVRS